MASLRRLRPVTSARRRGGRAGVSGVRGGEAVVVVSSGAEEGAAGGVAAGCGAAVGVAAGGAGIDGAAGDEGGARGAREAAGDVGTVRGGGVRGVCGCCMAARVGDSLAAGASCTRVGDGGRVETGAGYVRKLTAALWYRKKEGTVEAIVTGDG